MTARRRVLFLCTGNCCRSPMAEGFLRSHFGERFEALSAGVKPAGFVHPRAITVMAEAGVDISSQTSKSIRDFLSPSETVPDVVVAICSVAHVSCPPLPATVEVWHWPFDDPYHATGSEEHRMSEFRRVRDEIRIRIQKEFSAYTES